MLTSLGSDFISGLFFVNVGVDLQMLACPARYRACAAWRRPVLVGGTILAVASLPSSTAGSLHIPDICKCTIIYHRLGGETRLSWRYHSSTAEAVRVSVQDS